MAMVDASTSSLLTALKSAVLNPIDDLCVADVNKSRHFLSLLRGLYNSFQESSDKPFGPFEKLIVDGLDIESIWEELQTWNKPLTRFVKKRVKYLHKSIQAKEKVREKAQGGKAQEKEVEDESDEEEENGDIDATNDIDDNASIVDDDDDYDDEEVMKDRLHDDSDSDGDNENEKDLDEEMKIEIDLDRFEEMEDRARRRKEKSDKDGHKGATDMDYDEDEDDTSDVDDFAFAEENLYGSDNEDEDDGGYLMADDFFGAVPSSSKGNAVGSKKKLRPLNAADHDEEDDHSFDYGDDDDDDDSDDSDDDSDEDENEEAEGELKRSNSQGLWDDDDDNDDDDNDVKATRKLSKSDENLSNFERRQKAQMEEIKELEKKAVAKKSWEMLGEAKASDRPVDSLVDAEFDVDINFKRAPLITPTVTRTIEDMIIERIKEEKYDDVQRKVIQPVKVVDKTLPELSQEKSSLGLGQLYEDEFMERTTGTSVTKSKSSAKEDAICKEVDYLYEKVAKQLDALSHFHYTPKPTIAEPTFKALEVSSISLEEVAPAFLNDATISAPEELREKRTGRNSAFITEADIGRDDRKRLRKAIKTANKKAKLADNGGYKLKPDAVSNMIQKDRRIISGDDVRATSKVSKGSANFFQNLQHQVEMEVKNRGNELKRRKNDGADETES